jgi:catechol 2,3-dioxygenase-like lactoylglutathione lyase family enzyme
MKFDHVAISVSDIGKSIEWYKEKLKAKVLYQDETWAFLEAGGAKIALVLPNQHPGHLAFDVGPNPPADFLKHAKAHRDGSLSHYFNDPDGNSIEWIHYPGGKNTNDE